MSKTLNLFIIIIHNGTTCTMYTVHCTLTAAEASKIDEKKGRRNEER